MFAYSHLDHPGSVRRRSKGVKLFSIAMVSAQSLVVPFSWEENSRRGKWTDISDDTWRSTLVLFIPASVKALPLMGPSHFTLNFPPRLHVLQGEDFFGSNVNNPCPRWLKRLQHFNHSVVSRSRLLRRVDALLSVTKLTGLHLLRRGVGRKVGYNGTKLGEGAKSGIP